MNLMTAAAHEDPDPESVPPLSALEEAMRRALDSYSREQVLERVLRVLPTAGADPDDAPKPGLHGKVEKVSVSLPSELIQAIRNRTGTGGFSRYVAEAIQERVRLDLLDDLSAELEAEYGPIGEEGVREAMKAWPDYEES
jgi:Arc/MetJ-type ribon-helix-helix transcriptional regulator